MEGTESALFSCARGCDSESRKRRCVSSLSARGTCSLSGCPESKTKMAKATLEEIKIKADEYAKIAKQIERAEAKRDEELAPIVAKHEKKVAEIEALHDPKIERLQRKADGLKAEVVEWMATKKTSWAAEGEISVFGVKVGTKQLERVPDKSKLWDLCKKKGVEFFDLVSVALASADKALGKKEVDAISERREVPTRTEFLTVKD